MRNAPSRPMTNDERRAAVVDVAKVARLANLPMAEEERETFETACADVLAAFALTGEYAEVATAGRLAPFEDEPTPWPEQGVAAILAAAPRLDGRHLAP